VGIAFARSAAFLLAGTLVACARGGAPSRANSDAGVAEDAGAAPVPAAQLTAPSLADGGSTGSLAVGAATPPDAADAGALALDAGVAGTSPLPLSAAVAVIGGQDLPLGRDGSALVDPGASFRVEIAVPLTDGRLALHDEQDAMVASSGTSEVGTSWTRYRLAPDEPLRPGSTYALRVDGATAREAHDPSGRAYGPLALKVKTTGVRPAPAPAKKKRGKRRP
jgi:hypothetical protein